MKKGLALFLAALMSVSFMTGCGGKKNSDNTANTQTETAAGEQTEPQGEALTLEGAEDEVDMNKVEGAELSGVEAEDASLEAKGEIANCDIAIGDAKVIDYEDPITGESLKVAVVSFKFKNNNSTPKSFDGLLSVDAAQNGNNLIPVLVTGVEGINTNSGMVNVDTKDEITVQKTYRLNDEASDINITVYMYGDSTGASVSKAFKLN